MTQQQKILALMCQQPDKWFYPYEFMQPDLGDMFVGYKAPTRIAEMHKKYPSLFEIKSEDKYMQRKLNMKAHAIWYNNLDDDLKAVVDKYIEQGLPVEMSQGTLLDIPPTRFQRHKNYRREIS